MKNRRLTLQDIADKAGVSLTAASMYLNGKAKKYNLADATCERIEKVIRKNNFVPNLHARAIASKRTFLIGVQVRDSLEDSFWLKIISGIEEKLAEQKYHMIFSVSHYSPEKELESIRFMLSKGIDGLIIAPVQNEKNNITYLRKLNKSVPVATINSKIEGLVASYNDNYTGGCLASEYLIRKGHRKIAFIGNASFNRARAFIDTARQNKIETEFFPDVQAFLQKCDKYSAVFCFSDFILLALYNEASSRGIKIPGDISVIGYDNMDFIKLLSPVPSTVEQYKKEIGTAAAEMILSRLAGKTNVPDRIFTPILREGESVKDHL
jgi:LacI family transcriptional regulator